MHCLLDDGAIVFADAFAHTRLGLDDKLKNIAGLCATPLHPLTVSRAPARLLTRGGYDYVAKVFDPATLSPVSSSLLKPAPDAVFPNGSFFLGGQMMSPDGNHLTSVPAPFNESHASVDLGPSGSSWAFPFRINGGFFVQAWHLKRAATLCVHDLASEVLGIRLQVDVAIPDNGVLDYVPDAEGLTMGAWVPQVGTVTVVRVDAKGRELARMTVPSGVMPVLEPTRIVTQPTPDTVVSTPLDGGRATTFSLPKISAKADARPKAPPARDNVGFGLLVAGRSRTLFVPWHGETVLDLDRLIALDRKLPKKHADLRACITAHLREHRAELLKTGHERLSSLRESNGNVGITFWRAPNDGAFYESAQHALVPLVDAINALGPYRVAGYGSQG